MSKAIDVEEARELTRGSMKRKGLWFRARLAWLCGWFNLQIERAAERGETEREFVCYKNTYLKYSPLIIQCFRGLGYDVECEDYFHTITINWEDGETDDRR